MPLYLTFGLSLFCYCNITSGRVVLSLYALRLGAQPAEVGVLAATFFVFPLLLSWLIGRASDRFGARWLLLVGTVAGTIGMVTPYFVHELFALYIAGLLIGLAFAFYSGLLQNLVGLLSKPHQRTRNFSNASLLGSITNFLGPLIAGFAIDYTGQASACLYVTAMSLIAAVVLLLWGGMLPGGSHRAGSGGSVREMLREPGIFGILAISGLIHISQDLFQFYMPVYAHGIGLSASAIGAVLSAFAVAAFVMRLVMPRMIKRVGEETLLAYSFYLAALALMLIPFFEHAVALAAASFIFGLGMGCGQPIITMMLFSRAAEGRSGETFGIRLTVNNVLRVTTPTVFGLIASGFGLFPVFCINAVIMACSGALMRYGRSTTEH